MSDGIEGKARGRLGVSQTNRFSLLNCCIIPNPKRWPFSYRKQKKSSRLTLPSTILYTFFVTQKKKKKEQAM